MSTKFRKPPYFRFNVSDFLSSIWVQKMTAEQRGWYIMLLCRQWESESCMIPNDPDLLHVYAGADEKRFVKHGWIVIQRFNVSPDGRYLFNQRMLDDYEELLAYRMKLSENGKSGANNRWKCDTLTPLESVKTNGTCHSKVWQSDAKTETETQTENRKTKPSAKAVKKKTEPLPEKPEPEPSLPQRIAKFTQFLHEKQFGLKCQWDGREGKMVAEMLKKNPSWTADDYKRMLTNRFASDGIIPDRPATWLSNLGRYSSCPLDKYGKPTKPISGIRKLAPEFRKGPIFKLRPISASDTPESLLEAPEPLGDGISE